MYFNVINMLYWGFIKNYKEISFYLIHDATAIMALVVQYGTVNFILNMSLLHRNITSKLNTVKPGSWTALINVNVIYQLHTVKPALQDYCNDTPPVLQDHC